MTIPRVSADGSDMNTTSVSTMAMLIAKSGSMAITRSRSNLGVPTARETTSRFDSRCSARLTVGAGTTFGVVKNACHSPSHRNWSIGRPRIAAHVRAATYANAIHRGRHECDVGARKLVAAIKLRRELHADALPNTTKPTLIDIFVLLLDVVARYIWNWLSSLSPWQVCDMSLRYDSLVSGCWSVNVNRLNARSICGHESNNIKESIDGERESVVVRAQLVPLRSRWSLMPSETKSRQQPNSQGSRIPRSWPMESCK